MRHAKLVGAVSNCAVSTYHGTYTVRGKNAPTKGESVHLFLEFTIFVVCFVHHLKIFRYQQMALSIFA